MSQKYGHGPSMPKGLRKYVSTNPTVNFLQCMGFVAGFWLIIGLILLATGH